jgi:hypothetical protein
MMLLNRRAVQFIPSPALLHRVSCAPDAGQLPTHVERKDLGHLTNEYLFQGTRGLWFSLCLGVAPLHNILCAGPLSLYARLYQAGDAVALASTQRPFYHPHLVLKTRTQVPPELPPLMRQALQLARRLRREMSQLQPLQASRCFYCRFPVVFIAVFGRVSCLPLFSG